MVLGAFCDWVAPLPKDERMGSARESNLGWKKRPPVKLGSFFENSKDIILDRKSHFSIMDGQGLPSKTFDFVKRQRPPSEGILQELQKRQRPPSRTSYDEKPRPPGLQKRQKHEKPRPPSRRDVELMKRQRPPAMNVPLSVKRRSTSFDLMKRQRPPSEGTLQELQKR